MSTNYLIQLLPPESQARLLAQGELVDLRPRQILADRAVLETSVYFPEEGMISTQVKVGDRSHAGVGVVGRSGFAGAGVVTGVDAGIFRLVALCTGRAFKISAQHVRRLIREDPDLAMVLHRSLHVQLSISSQIAACNAFHSASDRLSRWLLTAAYMTGTKELSLSQETLSGLLGLRRPTVTANLSRLRDARLVDVHRRRIVIEDLEGLECTSCRCHKTIRREIRNNLLPPSELQLRRSLFAAPDLRNAPESSATRA